MKCAGLGSRLMAEGWGSRKKGLDELDGRTPRALLGDPGLVKENWAWQGAVLAT
jgi:hypothetical protein